MTWNVFDYIDYELKRLQICVWMICIIFNPIQNGEKTNYFSIHSLPSILGGLNSNSWITIARLPSWVQKGQTTDAEKIVDKRINRKSTKY